MQTPPSDMPVTLRPATELDRLGDEIALLSAHLEAATARVLALIREETEERRHDGRRPGGGGRHHRAVHEEGYGMERRPDGSPAAQATRSAEMPSAKQEAARSAPATSRLSD